MRTKSKYFVFILFVLIMSCKRESENSELFKECSLPKSVAEIVWADDIVSSAKGEFIKTQENILFRSGHIYNIKNKTTKFVKLIDPVLEILEDGYLTQRRVNNILQINRYHINNSTITSIVIDSSDIVIIGELQKQKINKDFYFLLRNEKKCIIYKIDLALNNLEEYYVDNILDGDFIEGFHLWQNENSEAILTLIFKNKNKEITYLNTINFVKNTTKKSKDFELLSNYNFEESKKYFPNVYITSGSFPKTTVKIELASDVMSYYKFPITIINDEYAFFTTSNRNGYLERGYMNLKTSEKYYLFATSLLYKSHATEHQLDEVIIFENVLYFSNKLEHKIIGIDAKSGCTTWLHHTKSEDFTFIIEEDERLMYVADSGGNTISCIKI